MKTLFTLLLFIGCLSVSAQSFDTKKLDRYLSNLENNNKAMFSLAITQQGRPIYQYSAGFADLANRQKSNEHTQYRIGSITKVFTATMIFQLIEEGELSLDTKLATFYPNIKHADEITISMLLNHRSGIHNFTDTRDYLRYETVAKTKSEMLDIFESLASDFAPNSRASYSNSGYVLLGFILEEITKSTYAAQLQQRISDKLKLKKTRYGGPIIASDNQALPYRFEKDKWRPTTVTDMSVPHGAGAIISTPTEIAIFMTSLFTGQLVSAESLAKMKELTDNYGRGLFRFPFYDRYAYGHNGGIDGFVSQTGYFEDEGLAIAFTANGLNYNLNDISIAMLSSVFERPYTIPDFSQKPIVLSSESLLDYEGVFTSKDLPLKITMKTLDGKLNAQATGQGPLVLTAYSNREFRFAPASIVILFAGDEDDVDYTSFELQQNGGRFKFARE